MLDMFETLMCGYSGVNPSPQRHSDNVGVFAEDGTLMISFLLQLKDIMIGVSLRTEHPSCSNFSSLVMALMSFTPRTPLLIHSSLNS